MNNSRTLVVNHVRDHATIYIFMIILFLTGIVFGAIIVNSMNFVQKQDLFFYLDRFFGQILNGHIIENKEIVKESFIFHAKYLLLLFVLGLSVIGLPIVWILIFVKGMVIGFSVGFIVNQLGVKGLILASISIVPQNILIIPIYITAGSLSMIFSLALLSKLFSRKISQSIAAPFLNYAAIFALLLSVALVAALLEAFVANEAVKAFIKSFY
ncbi:stage II sporulation protein M [Virgibacillus sp. W0430]|uniref:stage II sporulation protein M n=1 Tax=Virgibacillus sp. W0430 TaxID=3391580 RepID=UPI003F4520F0